MLCFPLHNCASGTDDLHELSTTGSAKKVFPPPLCVVATALNRAGVQKMLRRGRLARHNAHNALMPLPVRCRLLVDICVAVIYLPHARQRMS